MLFCYQGQPIFESISVNCVYNFLWDTNVVCEDSDLNIPLKDCTYQDPASGLNINLTSLKTSDPIKVCNINVFKSVSVELFTALVL